MKIIKFTLLIATVLLFTLIYTAPSRDEVHGLFDDLYNGKMYSGYLGTLNEKRKLHYVFVLSQNKPETDPVVLWLNGGPGCSSLLGLLQEHGPVIIPDYTTNMELNEFSWNKNANVIYLESPAGVGFSYNDDPNDIHWDDEKSGQDNRAAIIDFFSKFPEFKSNEFYISGESYAGVYVPYLAKLIIQSRDKINLKGILVGNGLTDLSVDIENALVDFAFEHALYSFETRQKYLDDCKNDLYLRRSNKVSKACNEARKEIQDSLQGINIYDIYRPCPPQNSNKLLTNQKATLNTLDKISRYNRMAIFTDYSDFGYSFNYDSEEEVPIWPEGCREDSFPKSFLNLHSTKHSLNVRDSLNFEMCNHDINKNYTFGESLDIYQKILIPSGLKIWFYSGDTDAAVPFNGSINWIAKLGLTVTETYRAWKVNNQVAGFVQGYGEFKFITVKGTGHMAPQWKREEVFILFNSFLKNENLPK
jgi:carboxypeptidase C (cathepsin A)